MRHGPQHGAQRVTGMLEAGVVDQHLSNVVVEGAQPHASRNEHTALARTHSRAPRRNAWLLTSRLSAPPPSLGPPLTDRAACSVQRTPQEDVPRSGILARCRYKGGLGTASMFHGRNHHISLRLVGLHEGLRLRFAEGAANDDGIHVYRRTGIGGLAGRLDPIVYASSYYRLSTSHSIASQTRHRSILPRVQRIVSQPLAPV
jgi:hypothetical protein